MTGSLLYGNGFNVFQENDAVVPICYFSKQAITYSDNSRSRVRLRLSGPGLLRLAQAMYTRVPENWGSGWGHSDITSGRRRIYGYGEAQQLWVEGATADTVVTGTIKVRRRDDNATTFADVVNPGGARLELLDDPAFRVAR